MKTTIPQKTLLIVAFDAIIIILLMLGTEGDKLPILCLLIWINMMIYCLSNISERCQILVFFLAFFLFLMGRQLLETYGFHRVELVFSEEVTEFSEKLVFISLLSFSFFVLLFDRLNVHFMCEERHIDEVYANSKYNNNYYKKVRLYSKLGFYLTYFFGIYSIVRTVSFVLANGYLAYYSTYINDTPYVIEKLGELSVLFFWIFISTMPTKKEIIIPTILFLSRALMTLGTGQRFEFVAVFLTVSVYFAMRNRINTGKKLWVSKRMVFFAVVFTPVIMVLMGYHNYIRFGSSWNFEHVSDAFVDFIYRQGVTANVLKRYKLYESSFDPNKYYMFSKTNSIIRNGIFGTLLGLEKFRGNSVEYATRGSSLAHALSYTVLGNRYLQGEGLGSSYIVETFHDISYVGVVIVNAIYAFLLTKVITVKRKSIWGFTLSISMLSTILFAIRGETDGMASIYLNISTWVIFLGLHFLSIQ